MISSSKTAAKLYTEAELDALRSMPKRIDKPGARWIEKPKGRRTDRQRNFQVSGGGNGGETRFLIYQRQNLEDEQDFSCGIAYLPRGASPLTLARYDGPSHEHGGIDYRPHIHLASERAMAEGRKAEAYAKKTDRFETLKGALACLAEDFNVDLKGVKADHDAPRLI